MGKKAKDHRKKIAKRNEGLKSSQKKAQKAQQEFLMKLIEEEKKKGMFNSPVTPLPGFDGPNLGMPVNVPIGPQI